MFATQHTTFFMKVENNENDNEKNERNKIDENRKNVETENG